MNKALLTLAFIAVSIYTIAQDGNFSLDKDYPVSPTGIIDLRCSDAKVTITGSARSTAHVKIDRKVTHKGLVFGEESFEVDVDANEGSLLIRERSHSNHVSIIGYYSEKYTIVIEAPTGVSLRIKGDDGNYLIQNIGGTIKMELDDADAELLHCTGDQFSFKIDDGDIRMDEGRGSLSVNADDGDIEIRHGAFTSIDARLDDADLLIETSLADNGNYHIQAEDGSVIFNVTQGGGEFDVRHDDGRIVTNGDFKIMEDDEDRTRIAVAKGSAKVDVRADDATIRIATR